MPLITRARHRVHLESACQFLQAFLETRVLLHTGSVFDVSLISIFLAAVDVVLGAEELRYAARAIGKISGVIDVEDVLDVVFKDFCIGK